MSHAATFIQGSPRAQHLVPPSLSHLVEAPVLASALLRKVEHCFSTRTRFPHTLLQGPADGSKRAIAHAIAAEMAAPVRSLDLALVVSPDDLHSVFRDAAPGAVVLVSGLHAASPMVLRDLARAAARTPIAPQRNRPHLPFADPALVRPERPARPYADFTIIATAREELDCSQFLEWVEARYYLCRTPATESARVTRLFARSGCQVDAASCRTIAELLVKRRIRTLPGVGAITDWMRSEGIQSVTWRTVDAVVADLLRHQSEPESPSAGPAAPASSPTESAGISADATADPRRHPNP